MSAAVRGSAATGAPMIAMITGACGGIGQATVRYFL